MLGNYSKVPTSRNTGTTFQIEMDDEDITCEGISRNVPKRPVQPRNQKFRMLPSPIVQAQRRPGVINIKEIFAMGKSSSPLNGIALIGCRDPGLQLPKHGLLFQPVSGQYKRNTVIYNNMSNVIIDCNFAVLRQCDKC